MQKSKPIRMAFLVSQYPAVSHTFILREVLALRKRGLAIEVASINGPDGLCGDVEKKEAEKTYYIKKQGVVSAAIAFFKTALFQPIGLFKGLFYAFYLAGTDVRKWMYSLGYFGEALILGCWLRKKRLIHVHVHFANPASMVALITQRIYGITFSMTIHGPDEFFDVQGSALAEKAHHALFVCCISDFARSQIMRLLPAEEWEKLQVVPLGVDTDVYTPRPFCSEPAPFELLSVGRLVPAKGQHVLVAALDLLVQDGRDVRLRLVGGGPDRQSLEKAVQQRGLGDRVIFDGPLTQEQTLKQYKKADIFVLASFAEGLPVVLMEAMAMEIACVATRIAGIPELIRNQIDGLLVRPGHEIELAAALARLMDDSTLRLNLSTAGRQRVLNKYFLDRNMEHLELVFREYL